MIGVELVRDRQTKERAVDGAQRARAGDVPPRRPVLGAGKNAIRLAPPLVLTKDQARDAAEGPRRVAHRGRADARDVRSPLERGGILV